MTQKTNLLSDSKIKKHLSEPAPSKMIFLNDGEGLLLTIMPATKNALWRYRLRSKIKGIKVNTLISLGRYPQISLKMAREKRFEIQRLIDQGIDPRLEKQQQEVKNQLIKDFAKYYYENRILASGLKPRTLKTIHNYLFDSICRDIGNIPLNQLTPLHIHQKFINIKQSTAPSGLRRLLSVLRGMLDYAVELEICERNVLTDKIKTNKIPNSKPRDRVLSEEEVKILINGSLTAQIHPQFKIAVLLLFITLLRKNELLANTFENIDFDKEFLHVPDSKTGKKINIPLPPLAINLLRQLRFINSNTEFMFVGKTPNKSPSDTAILTALRRVKSIQLKQYTIHDIRRTSATMLAAKGYPIHLVQIALNHSYLPKGAISSYVHWNYEKEHRQMLTEWSEYIFSLIEPGNKELINTLIQKVSYE